MMRNLTHFARHSVPFELGDAVVDSGRILANVCQNWSTAEQRGPDPGIGDAEQFISAWTQDGQFLVAAGHTFGLTWSMSESNRFLPIPANIAQCWSKLG